jgi:oxaloacetate decarboxylase (Na+ extruding) subunit gamma
MENLNAQFIEAGTLMLTGMVFVFGFLGLLVVFIKTILSKLADKYPDAVAQTRASGGKKAANKKKLAKGISPSVVAAVTSAVAQYRQKNNTKK